LFNGGRTIAAGFWPVNEREESGARFLNDLSKLQAKTADNGAPRAVELKRGTKALQKPRYNAGDGVITNEF
jgi:hypothetical protein